MSVHVGGVTATSIDSSDNIARRLPLLIGGVVLLSMLLLVASFRSIAVAVKAAVMNLLSVAAAYGVVALVLQGGWAGQLIGIDTPTPLPAFVPVLMFAVLFGLSMDYEVFLVSRMREGWLRTRDNEQAILGGWPAPAASSPLRQRSWSRSSRRSSPTRRGPQGDRSGHGRGDPIDATVVRLLLVPAVMHLLGRANWWMPARLAGYCPSCTSRGTRRTTSRPGQRPQRAPRQARSRTSRRTGARRAPGTVRAG